MVWRIKVSESFYIGVRADTYRNDTAMPVGMLVPFSTDKSFAQRKASVDDWLGRGQGSPYVKNYGTFILNNEPLHGFSLNTSKSAHGMCAYYSVRDPRGFDVGIPIDNACELLRTCMIDHGEIMSQCVYGRSGANTVLLPVDSPTYQEALTYTNLQEKKVSIRDVVAGNRVHLTNGLEAQYLGFLYPIIHADSGFLFHERRAHHFRIIDSAAKGMHIIRSAMVSKVLDHGTITPDEAEAMVADENWRMQQTDARMRLPYQYLTSTANLLTTANVSIEFEPTNRYGIRDSYQSGCSFTVLGTTDQVNFYRSTAYHFTRDVKGATVECNRVDPDAIRERGVFMFYYKPATKPNPSNLFASLFGNDVERKTLDYNMTDWYFVRAKLTNPRTGSVLGVRLSN